MDNASISVLGAEASMFFRCFILFCLSISLVQPVMAESLGNISVPLASRTSSDIQSAEKLALKQLIVKLTGQKTVESLSGVSELLNQPRQWLSRYGYDKTDTGQLLLTAHFDAKALGKALFEAGAPVWSLSRSPLLLWLVTPAGLTRTTDGAELEEAANSRGLSLILPAANSSMDAANIRGRFMQPVFVASQSQGTDLMATAVIYSGQPVKVRWWLYQRETLLTQGKDRAANLAAAKTLLVNQLTDAIARRYAVQLGKTSQYTLSVKKLSKLSDWHYLEGYLHDISGVKSVFLRSVDGDSVTWRLAFAGERLLLQRLLAVDNHLHECAKNGKAGRSVIVSTDAIQSNPSAHSAADSEGGTGQPSIKPLVFCWQ